jgi:predicted esterase
VKRVFLAARFTSPALLAVAAAACALQASPGRSTARAAEAPSRGGPDAVCAAQPAPAAAEALATPAPAPEVVLPVPGFPDAVVAEPIDDGRRGGGDIAPKRPLVIALHGLGGKPEPHCEAWRNITVGEAFVLCPRGDFDPQHSSPGDARYTLAGGEPLRQHIEAAVHALVERFGSRVDVDRPLLAGFSLGAAEAALLAQKYAAEFPRLALLEGGVDQWPEGNVATFLAHGGQRVLFGCGSGWCTPSASAASDRIERSGLGSRLVRASVGHAYPPALQSAVREELGWLLLGDGRWSRAVP